MLDRQRLPIKPVREKHVRSQQVVERQARSGTILAAEDDKGRTRRRAGKGHHDLLIEVREANATPPQSPTGPSGHAMKVRALLNACDALELLSDLDGCLDIAGNLNSCCLSLFWKANGKRGQAEARKVLDFTLAWWQGWVGSHT